MLYLLLHILCILCFFQIMRLVQTRPEPLLPLVTVNYLVAAAFAAVCVSVDSMSLSTMALSVQISGICVGVLYVVHLMVMFACIRRVGVGIAATVASVSAISPVLFSALVWSETLNQWQMLALLLLPLTLYLCRAVQQDPAVSRRHDLLTNILLLLNFLIASAISILHDAVDRLQENAQSGYTLYLFTAAGLSSILVITVRRQSISGTALRYGTLLGVVNGMATMFSLLALIQLSSVHMFPVASSAIIIGSALLAFLIWGERLVSRQMIGLFCAVLVIVLINLRSLINS